MTDIQKWEEADDRYARGVAMWQAAVRASAFAMGLSDLSTARFIEVSPRGAEMLGRTVDDVIGLNYLDVVDPPRVAAESFRLAREGTIDGIRTRRRLRRPDGSVVDTRSTGWVIRSSAGPDLGLWMAFELSAAEQSGVGEEVVAPAFPRQPGPELEGDRVTVDDRWRIIDIQSIAGTFLGGPVEEVFGRSLLELIHPDDIAALLFALARATTDGSPRAFVRLRHQDGTWRVIAAAPTIVEGEEAAQIEIVLAVDHDLDADPTAIPGHLRRIADQIEAARVLAPLAEATDALGLAATANLSVRQWEIVSRLVRGERVPTIASAMYLSRSTVRNHLSAIFAKVGVHSQQDLLALYRTETPEDTPAQR